MIRSAGGGGTFSHDATVLQVRLTTAQKLVVRHLKCHGLGPRIANRLVTLLYQHLMGLPLLGGALAAGCRVVEHSSPTAKQALLITRLASSLHQGADRDLSLSDCLSGLFRSVTVRRDLMSAMSCALSHTLSLSPRSVLFLKTYTVRVDFV